MLGTSANQDIMLLAKTLLEVSRFHQPKNKCLTIKEESTSRCFEVPCVSEVLCALSIESFISVFSLIHLEQ